MSRDAVLRASKDNDVDAMSELLSRDPGAATISNQIGQTGLHVAGIWGSIEAAKLLIKHGADVNARNQFGLAPLHGAAQSDRIEFIRLLIENGADPDARATNGMRPCDVAKTDEMRLLLGGICMVCE